MPVTDDRNDALHVDNSHCGLHRCQCRGYGRGQRMIAPGQISQIERDSTHAPPVICRNVVTHRFVAGMDKVHGTRKVSDGQPGRGDRLGLHIECVEGSSCSDKTQHEACIMTVPGRRVNNNIVCPKMLLQ